MKINMQLKKKNLAAFLAAMCLAFGGFAAAEAHSDGEAYLLKDNYKTFAANPAVASQKVQFHDRYGNTLVGDMYYPVKLNLNEKHAAIIVGHPYGGVKEQSSGLYAQELASRGFITLAFDLAYSGESGGTPRLTVSAETYVDDYSAAVDFMGTRPFVDRDRIGVLGICGSGGFVVSAASIDPRMKAVATVSMYDMGRAKRQGLNDAVSKEQLKKNLAAIAEQRWAEYAGAEPRINVGTPKKIEENTYNRTSAVTKEFYDYYRTKRGEHPNYKGLRYTSDASTMNFFPFALIDLISPRPLLMVVGENAHSKYFSDDAYAKAQEPKELYVVKNANHCDLYDQMDKIPFDKLEQFFKSNL